MLIKSLIIFIILLFTPIKMSTVLLIVGIYMIFSLIKKSLKNISQFQQQVGKYQKSHYKAQKNKKAFKSRGTSSDSVGKARSVQKPIEFEAKETTLNEQNTPSLPESTKTDKPTNTKSKTSKQAEQSVQNIQTTYSQKANQDQAVSSTKQKQPTIISKNSSDDMSDNLVMPIKLKKKSQQNSTSKPSTTSAEAAKQEGIIKEPTEQAIEKPIKEVTEAATEVTSQENSTSNENSERLTRRKRYRSSRTSSRTRYSSGSYTSINTYSTRIERKRYQSAS